MTDLAGKRAYVTGGAAGIGLAVAKRFLAAGASVVIADIGDPSEVAAAIGAHASTCNVADEQEVKHSLQTAAELLDGPLDIVVLNAGVGDVGPSLEDTDAALIEKVTRINQWGVAYGLKHAPAVMADGGSIIATSSMAAFINVPGAAIYSASKRAVTSLVEMAALELGGRGIRVNSVCPGYTDTAMGSGDEGRRMCEAFTALGRAATVDDLSGVFLFLASRDSVYMTGQSLKVDGGWHCGITPNLLQRVTGSDSAPA